MLIINQNQPTPAALFFHCHPQSVQAGVVLSHTNNHLGVGTFLMMNNLYYMDILLLS